MSHDKTAFILLIDDNPANLQLISHNLRGKGYNMATADNGFAALDRAKESPKPDLILLDIMMPEIDGYKVCEELKKNPETKDIPVIFFTAKISTEDIVRGFEAGAVDYITKPFNAAELIARVETHLKLKFLHEHIEEQNKLLTSLSTEKEELLAIAAHDLKNPLYNISMLAKVIRDDLELSQEEVKEFTEDIVTTSDRMLDLMCNLLDINAIEQGKIKLHLEKVNLNEVIEIVIGFYKERAAEKNIQLIYEPQLDKSYANVDRNAIIQIIDNILSNAIKYSPFDKSVFIKNYEDNDFCSFEIKDEGPGLSDADKTKLFGKFVKLSSRPTGNEQSNGLGLSIVKKYVETMNGSVICETELGKGCNFIVRIPVYKSQSIES